MLLDWIKREPVSFSAFADALIIALAGTAIYYNGPEVVIGMFATAAKLFVIFATRSAVVPTVKLSEATIEKAAGMDKADIAKVAEAKK